MQVPPRFATITRYVLHKEYKSTDPCTKHSYLDCWKNKRVVCAACPTGTERRNTPVARSVSPWDTNRSSERRLLDSSPVPTGRPLWSSRKSGGSTNRVPQGGTWRGRKETLWENCHSTKLGRFACPFRRHVWAPWFKRGKAGWMWSRASLRGAAPGLLRLWSCSMMTLRRVVMWPAKTIWKSFACVRQVLGKRVQQGSRGPSLNVCEVHEDCEGR